MSLLSRRRKHEEHRELAQDEEATLSSPAGEILGGHGLLAPWFIEYRLAQEIDRASRYGRPLTIMMASPLLLPGEQLSPDARASAAESALLCSRGADLVGWAGDDRIMIVMPETVGEVADVAAARWQNEMFLRGRSANGPKWDIVLLHDKDEFQNHELLQSMRQRISLQQARAA